MLEVFTRQFYALGSPNQISIVSEDSILTERIMHNAISEVARIEAKYSRYRSDSVLSTINRQAKTSPIAVDSETAQLLNYAESCFNQSNGLFDITSGLLRSIWDFNVARVPILQERQRICQAIGWQHVRWKEPYLQFMKEEMEIDFGGIGKEYAVDRAVEVLQREGISAGFVNLGGDLRAWGRPPCRSEWIFGIRHPRKEGQVIASLPITNCALASSGDYERYFDLNGKRYCHILNPITGMPVSELQSVSVIAPLCTLAGSCSTIALLLGKDKGSRFLRQMGVQAIMIDADGVLSKINISAQDRPNRVNID